MLNGSGVTGWRCACGSMFHIPRSTWYSTRQPALKLDLQLQLVSPRTYLEGFLTWQRFSPPQVEGSLMHHRRRRMRTQPACLPSPSLGRASVPIAEEGLHHVRRLSADDPWALRYLRAIDTSHLSVSAAFTKHAITLLTPQKPRQWLVVLPRPPFPPGWEPSIVSRAATMARTDDGGRGWCRNRAARTLTAAPCHRC